MRGKIRKQIIGILKERGGRERKRKRERKDKKTEMKKKRRRKTNKQEKDNPYPNRTLQSENR